MNREIKFRAWNGSEMITKSLQKEYDDYYMMNLEGEFFPHTRTGDNDFIYDMCPLNKQQYEIMQYTGLKDKNGMEIYEGDILGGYPHGTATVRWKNETAMFEVYWKEENYDEGGNLYFTEYQSLLYNELDNCWDEWVVLGNIYQNPALLS